MTVESLLICNQMGEVIHKIKKTKAEKKITRGNEHREASENSTDARFSHSPSDFSWNSLE